MQGSPGRHYPKSLLGSARGQGPRMVPMPYLGQQPQGEEECGVHRVMGE